MRFPGNLPFLAAMAVAAVLAFPVTAFDAELSRDGIWRSIFKRPAETPVPVFEMRRRALGERLFGDARLSGDGRRACRSCHQPENGFTDGLARAQGRDGQPLRRNTPHLWNLASAPHLFWDGRAESFETQALGPLFDANEMASDMPKTLSLLAGDAEMAGEFAAASPRTRFDLWADGDDAALDETEKAGFAIFTGKGGCVSCHGGWRFTDDQFHDIGLETADPGRGAVQGGTQGIAQFKTPGLRQVARTAPYMHDGSKSTLEDVVQHYAGQLKLRPSVSANIVRGLTLDAAERAALAAFLKTL